MELQRVYIQKYPRPSDNLGAPESLPEMHFETGVPVLPSPILPMHPPLYPLIDIGHKCESSYEVYNQVYTFSFRLIMIDK